MNRRYTNIDKDNPSKEDKVIIEILKDLDATFNACLKLNMFQLDDKEVASVILNATVSFMAFQVEKVSFFIKDESRIPGFLNNVREHIEHYLKQIEHGNFIKKE